MFRSLPFVKHLSLRRDISNAARGAIAGLLFLLAGCAASREAVPFVTESSQTASVRWQQGGRVFVRGAVCERSQSGAVRVTFGEKPAVRQFALESSGWFVTKGWAGQAGEAPLDLSVWASFLTIYQNADRLPDGERELHTPAARVAVNKTGEGLRSVSIRSQDSAESLSVVFR